MRCNHNISLNLYCPECDYETSRDTVLAKENYSPHILFGTRPSYLKNAANYAVDGCYAFLDPILPLLSHVSSRELNGMHPNTLLSIARIVSWRRHSAVALDLLSHMLKGLSINDLLQMHPETVSQIGYAASIGSPSALNSISLALSQLRVNQLSLMHKDTLYHIALASLAGSHTALQALTSVICGLSARFYTTFHPDTFLNIVQAYSLHQESTILYELADFYCNLSNINQRQLDPNGQLEHTYPNLFLQSTPPLSSDDDSLSSCASSDHEQLQQPRPPENVRL